VFARVDIARDISAAPEARDGYWVVKIERCLSAELFLSDEGVDLRVAGESFGFGIANMISHRQGN
jgi:hypothetical protein